MHPSFHGFKILRTSTQLKVHCSSCSLRGPEQVAQQYHGMACYRDSGIPPELSSGPMQKPTRAAVVIPVAQPLLPLQVPLSV